MQGDYTRLPSVGWEKIEANPCHTLIFYENNLYNNSRIPRWRPKEMIWGDIRQRIEDVSGSTQKT